MFVMIRSNGHDETIKGKLIWQFLSVTVAYLSIFTTAIIIVCAINQLKYDYPVAIFLIGVTFDLFCTVTKNLFIEIIKSFVPFALLAGYTIFSASFAHIEQFAVILLILFVFTIVNLVAKLSITWNRKITKGAISLISLLIFCITAAAMFVFIQNIESLTSLKSPYILVSIFDSVTKLTYSELFVRINVIAFVVFAGLQAIYNLLLASELQQLMSRYASISKWSVDEDVLTKNIDDGYTQRNRTKRAVLIGDIRGYTAFSEKNSPDIVLEILENFYKIVETSIVDNKGFKPEFIGDEFVTYFDSVKDAVTCALEIKAFTIPYLSKYNLDMGMGLEYGDVIEGFVGGNESKKYTVIGLAINVAARLQSIAVKGEILVRRMILEECKDVVTTPNGTIVIKGLSGKHTIYNVTGFCEKVKKVTKMDRVKEYFRLRTGAKTNTK